MLPRKGCQDGRIGFAAGGWWLRPRRRDEWKVLYQPTMVVQSFIADSRWNFPWGCCDLEVPRKLKLAMSDAWFVSVVRKGRYASAGITSFWWSFCGINFRWLRTLAVRHPTASLLSLAPSTAELVARDVSSRAQPYRRYHKS